MATERMVEAFAASMAQRVVEACLEGGHVFSGDFSGEPDRLRSELAGSMAGALLRGNGQRHSHLVAVQPRRQVSVPDLPPAQGETGLEGRPVTPEHVVGRPVPGTRSKAGATPKSKVSARTAARRSPDPLPLFDRDVPQERLPDPLPAMTTPGGTAGKEPDRSPSQARAPLGNPLPSPRRTRVTREAPPPPRKTREEGRGKRKPRISTRAPELPLSDLPLQVPEEQKDADVLDLRQVFPDPDLPVAEPSFPPVAPVQDDEVATETPEETALRERIGRSVTFNHIECLEDGKMVENLRRHLKKEHRMSPEEYREKWGLPAEYPMIAPNHQRVGPKFSEFLKRQQGKAAVARP